MKIYILLASYNGSDYIGAQVESIQRQSFEDWLLLIRDDGSTDGTISIIHQIAKADPRICLIADDLGNQGVVGNFGLLLKKAYESDADYVFLSDQDDIWDQNKMDLQMRAMHDRENKLGKNKPLLVYSDLSVVDTNLHLLHRSFMTYSGLHHVDKNPIKTLLVQNFVTGCTTLINRALLGYALPLPTCAPMHDWWLALCAAALGNICYIRKPTVLYRQHENNLIGANGFWPTINPMRWRYRWGASIYNFHRGLHQAQELHERLIALPTDSTNAQVIESYCRLFENSGTFNRLKGVLRLGIRRQPLLMTMALCLQVVRSRAAIS